MKYFWPIIQTLGWFVTIAVWLFLALLAMSIATPAKADIVTEFGMGVKLENSTSVILLPACHTVDITELRPNRGDIGVTQRSCGGDNPAFIGWPIAWEREFSGGIWRVRAGWFHYSNWFDGGHDRETHMDVAAITTTFNWTARKRRHR